MCSVGRSLRWQVQLQINKSEHAVWVKFHKFPYIRNEFTPCSQSEYSIHPNHGIQYIHTVAWELLIM